MKCRYCGSEDNDDFLQAFCSICGEFLHEEDEHINKRSKC